MQHEKESPRRAAEQEQPAPERPLTPEELAGDGPKMEEVERKERHVEGAIPTPSQAEGERETVEADLRARERRREPDRVRAERRSGGDRRRGERRKTDRRR